VRREQTDGKDKLDLGGIMDHRGRDPGEKVRDSACDGQVMHQGRTGAQEPSERHENARSEDARGRGGLMTQYGLKDGADRDRCVRSIRIDYSKGLRVKR